MSFRDRMGFTVALVFLAVAALMIGLVWSIVFWVGRIAWTLFVIAGFALAIPICVVWTSMGLLSFRTQGWQPALKEASSRLFVTLFAAFMIVMILSGY